MDLTDLVAAVVSGIAYKSIVLILSLFFDELRQIIIVPSLMSFLRDLNKHYRAVHKVVSTCFDAKLVYNCVKIELVEEEADFIENSYVACWELNSNEAFALRTCDRG